MKCRTLALAAVLTLAPATAHATYTDPEQTGHAHDEFVGWIKTEGGLTLRVVAS